MYLYETQGGVSALQVISEQSMCKDRLLIPNLPLPMGQDQSEDEWHRGAAQFHVLAEQSSQGQNQQRSSKRECVHYPAPWYYCVLVKAIII